METAQTSQAGEAHATLSDAPAVRPAIFSTYPPRVCGIGMFSFDVRSALPDVPRIDRLRSRFGNDLGHNSAARAQPNGPEQRHGGSR